MNSERPITPETYDFAARYAKYYDTLISKAEKERVPVEPLTLENHRTKYAWAHQFVQAAVMQRIYQDEIRAENTPDEWVSQFSKEFNEAFRETISLHQDLLHILRTHFEDTVTELEEVLREICQIEAEVKADFELFKTTSEGVRDAILGVIKTTMEKHPDYLHNRVGSHESIKREVEASLGINMPE